MSAPEKQKKEEGRKEKMSKEVSEEAEQQQHGKDYRDPPPAPLIDMGELKLWAFYRALIAEFIATLLFLYVTIATVIGHKKQPGLCDGVGLLGIAWSFGGMIFILVYCTAGISGSNHLPLSMYIWQLRWVHDLFLLLLCFSALLLMFVFFGQGGISTQL